jgi:FkbM family methyltransferase
MPGEEKVPLTLLLGNKLFEHCFPLYRILYKPYKMLTERQERAVLKEVIRAGMTVVDVGANIGIYTGFLAKLVGETGRVYAFEPSPYNFELLTRYTRSSNVTALQAAVGDKTGEISLYLSDKLNVDHRTYQSGEGRREIRVPSYCLDDYFKDEKIDFIKMDIQGFEYQALLGMKNILQSNPKIKLIMEFWPWGLMKAGSSAEEVVKFLRELDFQMELMEGGKRLPCPPVPQRRDFSYYHSLFVFRR